MPGLSFIDRLVDIERRRAERERARVAELRAADSPPSPEPGSAPARAESPHPDPLPRARRSRSRASRERGRARRGEAHPPPSARLQLCSGAGPPAKALEQFPDGYLLDVVRTRRRRTLAFVPVALRPHVRTCQKWALAMVLRSRSEAAFTLFWSVEAMLLAPYSSSELSGRLELEERIRLFWRGDWAPLLEVRPPRSRRGVPRPASSQDEASGERARTLIRDGQLSTAA